MTLASPPTPLTAGDIESIAELVYRWTGMTFSADKRYYIERRVSQRMARSGIADVRTYLGLARSSAAEREALINAFTINETYFYREDHQLAALSKDILPAVIAGKRPGDLVRIGSIPCSTGEEAYSVAIWLLENWALVDAYNVEIVGADIDTHALERARAGHYGSRSVKRLSPQLLATYFEPEHGRGRKIIDDMRESVRFVPLNIMDPVEVASLGRFDVILCRNLLIYFDDPSRAEAAANLYDALNPGGFLCLGHSESMARISDRFTMVRFDDAIVYRRP